jgi:prepilin-type N-terminal cleavage/methylation domain-containing protein
MGHGFSRISRIEYGLITLGVIRVHLCSSVSKLKPSAPQRLSGRTGFTLLEILVAIAMIGIILATLFGVFTGIVSSSQQASRKAELYQTGRALMDLMCEDIRGFFPLSTAAGEVFFYGFSSSSQEDQELVRMDFTTTHTLPIGIERNPFLCEVGYSVKKNTAGPLYTLWRRSEYPPALPFEVGGREVPVCRILESFRLAFVTKDDTKFSLAGGVIPDAVVLSFTLNLEGEREQFVTMARPMVKF